MKVFVGLSGGVDSAVSAALLQQQGHEVVGAFIRIALPGYPCTAGEDKIEAQRVAAHLRIPFVEIDLSEAYQKKVFEISLQAFSRGRTPNPDVLCNREIKFGLFYAWCMQQGAERVATGHYAQVKDGLLYAGADTEKDQSYFLALVPQAVLQKTLFPIGALRKAQVRALAHEFDLPNAERKDSQGLCFLGPLSVSDLLERELHPTPGSVLNEEGSVIGKHDGALLYTLGQRHGFTIAAPTPHYVIAKDAANNTITVSTNKFPQHTARSAITLSEPNWIGDAPDGPCQVRYRYRQQLIPAEKRGDTVVLHEPHYAPAGQGLVVYRAERCLGGGSVDTVQQQA